MFSRFFMSLVCAIGMAFSAGAARGKDTIKIGLAGPFSGFAASFGEQLWQGGKLAVKHINAKGGINGHKVELIKADDACEPKQAVAVANKLTVKDKVDAVIGHFCSSSTMPASTIYAENNVLMITPASTNPKITTRKLKTVFRTCGRDDQQGVVAAEFIVKRLKAKRVAIVHDKDTYGRGFADEVKKNLKNRGLKVVMYEGLTRGEKDFNALVTKIKSLKADTVFFGGVHSEAGPLVRQMRQQGLKAHFVSGDGIVSDEMVVTAGGKKFVKGIYMTYSREPRNQPAGKKIVAEYRKMGFEPEGYTLYTYAAVQAVAAAMKATLGKSERPNGMKMAKWLKRNTVKTVLGPRSWDKNGDLTVVDYVVYKWTFEGKNRKYRELRPNEL